MMFGFHSVCANMRLIKGKDGEKLLTVYFEKQRFCFLVLSKTQVYLLISVYCSSRDVVLLWHQQKLIRFSLYSETASVPALLKESGSWAEIQTAQALLNTGNAGLEILFTGRTSLQSGLDLQHRNVLEEPKWLGCHIPVCLMELVNKMVPANLETTQGAGEGHLWAVRNGKQLWAQERAVSTPHKVSNRQQLHCWSSRADTNSAHPTWIITCWSTG